MVYYNPNSPEYNAAADPTGRSFSAKCSEHGFQLWGLKQHKLVKE
jgi:hypothetical protein